MSLQAAILASLVFDNACTGYELSKEHIDCCVSTVWQVPQQQIYRELKRMEEEGWITSSRVSQENRLDKKVYEITSAGYDKLKGWVETPIESAAIRDAMLVKIFSGHVADRQSVLIEIERHQQLHQQELDDLLKCCGEHFADVDSLTERKKYIYLVIQHRIGQERHWVEWCQYVKTFLSTQTA